ncbi:helix-turn-helix domain-containing protein [Sphingobacterium sp. LRF_L2]|uniref:helix-turn-helix domain-containing protein n=1 Tax=Sphingobacterium sp. LRF_L2 TaxID=3369421 RepID=UPI003F600894
MTDYKTIKIKEIKQILTSLIQQRLVSDEEKRFLQQKINDTIGTSAQSFSAIKFLIVAKLIKIDIDDLCENVFHDHKWKKLDWSTFGTNHLKTFLTPFTFSQNSIAEYAGIEKARLSRVMNGLLETLYPHEVYGLAKAFDLNPSELFDYFYGNGEKPLVGL